MNNIHLTTKLNQDMIDDIIDDERLTPTARFLLIEMFQHDENKIFDEFNLFKKYPLFDYLDIFNGFDLLVELGYLKRISIYGEDIQYHISPTGEMNNENKHHLN